MRRLLLAAVLAALALPAGAAARPDPVTWCGTGEATANRVPDLELSSRDQVRMVYAVPADGADAFLANAPGIATDAAWIDEWWQAQDASRAPRFDLYPFPGCASTWGQLDIGFVRLPNRSAVYTLEDTPLVRLDRDLRGAFPPAQKTIVYYDGPVSNDRVCGETNGLDERAGGDQGIVYVYLQSSCGLAPPGGGASAEVAAHELLHNLGAVPSGAPHECPDSPSHACDSPLDIMEPFIADGSTLDDVQLDVGRDDYYGHPADGRWDVRSSSWLAHLPQLPFSLAVAGAGAVVARAGGGVLPCARGCAAVELDAGARVTVVATPAPGWVVSSWSGGCTGRAPTCAISAGAAARTVVTFARARLRVAATVSGRGSVTSRPAGIACPRRCAASFAAANAVLAARPAPGWTFSRWLGTCTTRKTTCTVTASGAAHAVFIRRRAY